jgi:hypothetical protein
LDYAERYIELGSMVFDLYPFIPFLNKDARLYIAEKLSIKVEE